MPKAPENGDVETRAAQPEPTAAPPEFTVERLRRDCLKLFGVTPSTFDGATHGLRGRYSVEGMREHIQNWQKTRVVAAQKKEVK